MKEYWNEIIPDILSIKSDELVFKNNCGSCEHRSICEWCPAKSCLNTGHLYLPIDYYCSKIKNKNN